MNAIGHTESAQRQRKASYGWLLLALLLSGCALAPDTYTASLVHVSQPNRGMGPSPIGSNGRLAETTFEACELGARWQRGKVFAETSLAYVLHETNMVGNDWLFTARTGLQWSGR